MIKLIGCILFAAATLHAQSGKLPIGMNIPGNNYYSPALIFTDVMKTASAWITYDYGVSGEWNTQLIDSIPKDTCGYPLELPYTVNGKPQAVRFLFNNYYTGTYVVLYDGDGEFAWNVPHTYENGRHYVTLNGQGGHVWVQITRSAAGNHVRNIRILPQEYEDAAAWPTFTPRFVDGLRPFHALRFMDWINTNNSTQQEWSNRRRPSYYSQGVEHGIAIDYAIELANLLECDPWFCVPHLADDNYITSMAQLIKAKLDPSLKAYIEYSNEIWNWQFQQSGWVVNNAAGSNDQYVIDDLVAINPAGADHPEKDAYMMARTFRLFSAVFADAPGRIVRVAAVQHSWYDNTRRVLEYLFNVDGNGCDAVSPGGYFNFNGDQHAVWNAMDSSLVTPEMILAGADSVYAATSGDWTMKTADFARQYGVDYLVYEGGQHMQPYQQGEWGYNHAVWDAQIHPGMYDLYMKNFAVHTDSLVDCKLFMAFSYVGERESRWGSWGHLERLDQLDSLDDIKRIAPKYAALLDVNTPRDSSAAVSSVKSTDIRTAPDTELRFDLSGRPVVSGTAGMYISIKDGVIRKHIRLP